VQGHEAITLLPPDDVALTQFGMIAAPPSEKGQQFVCPAFIEILYRYFAHVSLQGPIRVAFGQLPRNKRKSRPSSSEMLSVTPGMPHVNAGATAIENVHFLNERQGRRVIL